MHVDMSVTRRRAKRRVSVHFVKFFREQLFLTPSCAHDKMVILPGPIRPCPTGWCGQLGPGTETNSNRHRHQVLVFYPFSAFGNAQNFFL